MCRSTSTRRLSLLGRDRYVHSRLRSLHPLDPLLLAAPFALAAASLHWSPAALFFTSGLAIVPLARLIGASTEQLAGRLGAAAGGLLNAMFGNILAVLGLACFLGGLKRERQRFDRTAASAAGAQLAVAAGALLIPAVLAATSPIKAPQVERLSVVAAIVLLLGYGAGLVFSLRTHAHLYAQEQKEGVAVQDWSVRRSVIVLLLATIGVAYLSELLVEGVKGVTEGLGWTPTFVGVILIALIGNAAEHASAVSVAVRGQMDLSLSIALGSAAQIALFVAPVLVLIGLAIGHPIDLLFDRFSLAGIAIAVALVNLLIHDG